MLDCDIMMMGIVLCYRGGAMCVGLIDLVNIRVIPLLQNIQRKFEAFPEPRFYFPGHSSFFDVSASIPQTPAKEEAKEL